MSITHEYDWEMLYAHNQMSMNIRTNLYGKNDLTPRQVEWCRAWLPAFADWQAARGVK